MKKIAIKDNKICEAVGLAKKPVELNKVIPVSDSNYGRLALNLNADTIKEGIYRIDDRKIYYKAAPKRVMQRPLDVTIVTNDEITRELVSKGYDYWVPETKWKIKFYDDYVDIVTAFIPDTDTPMFPYLTNVFEGGGICLGGSLAGINVDNFNRVLENAGEIVNSVLCGTPNTDLYFVGLGRTLRISAGKSRDLHKFFLQLSFIHQNVIHNQEEASLWWKPIIDSTTERTDREGNLICDFFYDLVAMPLYDERLLERYSLEKQEERAKDENYGI